MTLDELVRGIAAVDKVRGGCAVTLTTINTPPAARGTLYGYVTVGMGEAQFVFHSEDELARILARFTEERSR